jgi:phage/plasmid-associated DNA primase
MHHNPYHAPHTCKFMILGNVRPASRNTQDATGTRWIECEFKHVYLPKNEYDALPDDARAGASLKNPDFVNECITDENIQGIINFSLDHLQDLHAEKYSFAGLTGDEMVKRWKMDTDSIFAFLEIECDRDFALVDCTEKKEVYEAYTTFCDNHGFETLSTNKFTREMNRNGHGLVLTRHDGAQVRVYKGISVTCDVILDDVILEDLFKDEFFDENV